MNLGKKCKQEMVSIFGTGNLHVILKCHLDIDTWQNNWDS
jgi:hypothetical protein